MAYGNWNSETLRFLKLFLLLKTCSYFFIFPLSAVLKFRRKWWWQFLDHCIIVHWCEWDIQGLWWHSYWFDPLKSVVIKASWLCPLLYDLLTNHVIRDDCGSREHREILRHQDLLALNKGVWGYDEKLKGEILGSETKGRLIGPNSTFTF